MFKRLKEEFNGIPNSVKFWNGLAMTCLIIISVINFELLWWIWVFGSIIVLGLFLEDRLEFHYWPILMPITWIAITVVIISVTVEYLYKKFISRFNSWLDNKNK